MRFNFYVILILSSLSAFAENEICLDPDLSVGKNQTANAIVEAVKDGADGDCPNPKKLRGLCMVVDSASEDSNPQGNYIYKYQTKILEAACIDVSKDSESQIAAKISKMWKENEDSLVCNNTKFDVANGSLIKFAVSLKFDEFITDVIQWKVNLNKVDATDGKTVLDYIKDQIPRNKGLPHEAILQKYYDQLRRAGAKHKTEL